MCLYGGAGAGKSFTVWKFASRLQQTGSDAQFFLMDCDGAFYDNAEEFPEVSNIVHLPFDADEWGEFEDVVEKSLSNANPKRGDWFIVDRIDPTWESVQQMYSRQVKGVDIDDWRVGVMAKKEKGGAKSTRGGLEGEEWAIVKRKFRKPYTKMVTSGCNVLLIAGEKKVGKADGDFSMTSKEDADTFGSVGYMPAGQKDLPHMCRDIIRLRAANSRTGDFRATAAKSRGRTVKLDNTQIKDASVDILLKVCGWKIAAQ